MPTYEYQCKKCKHEFEVFQQITEKPIKNCPKCKGDSQRLISAGGGFILKGSGFYATDNRSSEYKQKASQDAKPCKGKESKSCKDCPANKAEK